MALRVVVKSATDLPAMDRGGLSDPYTKLIYSGKTFKTKTIKKALNPTWNENFEFVVTAPVPGDAALQVRVFDWDRIGSDELIGKVDLYLKDIKNQGYNVDSSYPLVDKKGQPITGKIQLTIQFDDPEKESAADEEDEVAEGEGGAADPDEEAGMGDGDEGEVAGQVGAGDPAKKTRLRKRRAATARKAAERKQRRDEMVNKFPDKVLDFQVRVHVIEARRLVSKVQPLDPVTTIFVGNQNRQTRVVQDSDKPYWDETFFFELKMKPCDVFDQIMKLKIDHSRTFRKDALIGSFELDLGAIYIEDDHAIVHKWLLLTNPSVASGDAKGFLKVSLMVLGPGDPAVRLPKLVMDDQVDIESNVLRPVGAQLQSAILEVNVFKAEDVPRMDVGFFSALKSFFTRKKEDIDLVDPYVEITFAGKRGRTEYHKQNANPEFNEKITLGIKIPSMCERIRVRIMDRDSGLGAINKDDVVGTAYIPLSQISVPGEEGFLPQFGPSFINVYGAPRKFDLTDEYDYLNEGLMEGAAYRGRVLLEIATSIGSAAKKEPVESLTSDEMKQAVPYLRRRKFVVNAVFFDATMVSETDGVVEFEVSVGNYGNQLDGAAVPQPSTTDSSTPTYNGNYYYYIPWNNKKPCCSVTCQFEDITYRLESLSILTNTYEHLAKGLKKVKDLLDFEATPKVCASAVIQVLNGLLEDLSPQNSIQPPNPNSLTITKLDLKLFEVRKAVVMTVLEEAKELRDNATDVQQAVEKCGEFVARLRSLTFESQNSFPDIIIWMLSSKKRVAFARVPAHHLFYSDRPLARGRLCGQMTTLYLKYHGKKGISEKSQELPGQLRLKMWLGLAEKQSEWNKTHAHGSMAVFAETYENQSKIPLFGWKDAVGRPDWSDCLGKVSMPREEFIEPEGWKWDGEFTPVPPNSYTGDLDSDIDIYEDDVFEYQTRPPAANWSRSVQSFGDVQGNVNDEIKSLESIEAPKAWQWIDPEWHVDINRAVDEEGWEYTVDDLIVGYSPAEKVYHLTRRRRWLRSRQRIQSGKEAEKVELKPFEMFEFARIFRTEAKYHFKSRTFDLARRRRWLRTLVASQDAGRPFFEFKYKDDVFIESPRTSLTFKDPFVYELRAYVYQARDIRSGDETGMSDAYCRVSFQRRSLQTRIVKETLMPTWDETLIFDNIQLFEDPQQLLKNPPEVVIEVFDKDTIAKDDFLGRACAPVFVHANAGVQPVLQWYPIMCLGEDSGELLACFHLIAVSENPAIKKQQLPRPTQTRDKKYIVPSGIRPEMQRYRIEVLTWGVRDMKRYQALTVTSPTLQVECCGLTQTTEPIEDTKKNPNFLASSLTFESVYLPKKKIYCPPLNIRVLDHRAFGRKPCVGLHCVESLDTHRLSDATLAALMPPPSTPQQAPRDPKTGKPLEEPKKPATVALEVDTSDPDKKEEENYDWWSKFYASMADSESSLKVGDYLRFYPDKIKIYDCSLEDVPQFHGLSDFLDTFPLYRGKSTSQKVAGTFKGAIKILPLSEDETDAPPPRMYAKVPSSNPISVTIRVYVVRAMDLTPKDDNGKNDAYLVVHLGKEKLDSRDNYIPNETSPVFGSFFELKGVLPIEHELKIEVKDYDLVSADDLIGETIIDLENRYLTKHRGTVGIPDDYYIEGVNKWRDSKLPSVILDSVCERLGLPKPDYSTSGRVRVGAKIFDVTGEVPAEPLSRASPAVDGEQVDGGGQEGQSLISGAFGAVTSAFKSSEKPKDDAKKKLRIQGYLGVEKERLAVKAMRGMGDPNALVPEHIETRPLFCPSRPGVEQGRLQLWIDMFVDSGPIPPPVDIESRKPREYVLRCIVWNTEDVILDESNLFGEEMSDIYVSGWLRGIDEKQKTDVHYRSLNGEGNFNWRLVFPFCYYPTEQCISVTKKEHFWSLDKTERRLPPKLVMQVWDNDIFNPDDYLGDIELNLNDMIGQAKSAKACSLKQFPQFNEGVSKEGTFNLFEHKRVRGWWPMKGKLNEPPEKKGQMGLTGKVELELEIVTKEEAEERPAGKARDDPNMNPKLDPPNRPDTSFFWFTSPWKSCKYIIWRRLKWLLLALLIIGIVVLFLVLFFYNFPGYTVRKLLIGS
eukprot:m.306767 g.306767  ORF g.306767 m.306767 type:complete len:2096 (+) comp41575_c0_seq1:119-6406(+)